MCRSWLSKQGWKVGSKNSFQVCGGGEELVQNYRDVRNLLLDSALLEHEGSRGSSSER